MAKVILSDSFYTLHFSEAQMGDHQQLLLIGSVLSQWFTDIATSWHDPLESLSTAAVLQRLISSLDQGQVLAQQWCELFEQLQPVYDHPSKAV